MIILLLIITGALAFLNAYAHFGRGTGPSLLDQLRCTGNEQNLLNCSHSGRGVTASYCNHYHDVGVRCLGKSKPGDKIVCEFFLLQPTVLHFAILASFSLDNCTDGSVRLTHGSTPRNGTVQVCISRTWGSICDSGWNSRAADVVCRQLGFSTFGNRYLTSLSTLACCAFQSLRMFI